MFFYVADINSIVVLLISKHSLPMHRGHINFFTLSWLQQSFRWFFGFSKQRGTLPVNTDFFLPPCLVLLAYPGFSSTAFKRSSGKEHCTVPDRSNKAKVFKNKHFLLGWKSTLFQVHWNSHQGWVLGFVECTFLSIDVIIQYPSLVCLLWQITLIDFQILSLLCITWINSI